MSPVDNGALSISRTNVLIGGYLNLNVVDGSCFWLAGLTRMFAEQTGIHVDVASPGPVVDDTVISEFRDLPDVRLLEPDYESSRQEYAEQLARIVLSGDYDVVIIRDTETSVLLRKLLPNSDVPLFVYVTGTPSLGVPLDAQLIDDLNSLSESGTTLLFQTPEMQEHAEKYIAVQRSAVLPPLIPDSPVEFSEAFTTPDEEIRLIYSGKFFYEWNPDGIISAFKAVERQHPGKLHLTVTGSQFKQSSEDPHFVSNVKYLLSSTPGVTWHGAVKRDANRRLIANSHYGISWRRGSLDSSSELSTKVLEYGSLGLPVILNRTRVHEKLLGEDYPFFVNSTSEFKTILRSLRSLRPESEEAAKRCFRLSQKHTYSVVYPSFAEVLGIAPRNGIYLGQKGGSEIAEKIDVEAGFLKLTGKLEGEEWLAHAIVNLAQELSSERESTHTSIEPERPLPDKQIEKLQRDLKRTEKQLANLNKSKAVRLQRKLWLMRKRLRQKLHR